MFLYNNWKPGDAFQTGLPTSQEVHHSLHIVAVVFIFCAKAKGILAYYTSHIGPVKPRAQQAAAQKLPRDKRGFEFRTLWLQRWAADRYTLQSRNIKTLQLSGQSDEFYWGWKQLRACGSGRACAVNHRRLGRHDTDNRTIMFSPALEHKRVVVMTSLSLLILYSSPNVLTLVTE